MTTIILFIIVVWMFDLYSVYNINTYTAIYDHMYSII